MATIKTFLLCAFPFLPTTLAWGVLGHYTVGFMAAELIKDETAKWARSVLNDASATSYLANVSVWADSWRNTVEGSFSAPFHYIDVEDSPPEYCGVDFERDCAPEGCVVSALANYTERVMDPSLSAVERDYALRFIVHVSPSPPSKHQRQTRTVWKLTSPYPQFTGDIHQPLHNEGARVGGNTIFVTFDNRTSNLHRVWDTNIIEKYWGTSGTNGSRALAANLTAEIEDGKYERDARAWLRGLKIDDPVGTALSWSRDANSFVCTDVLPDGVEALDGAEVGGEYYRENLPVVLYQIARGTLPPNHHRLELHLQVRLTQSWQGGFRLAAWLDLIATGSTPLDDGAWHSRPSKGREGGHGIRLGRNRAHDRLRERDELANALNSPFKLARREFGDDCGCH